ncbi:MAG: nucleoside monophosphate kinase [Candidatus Nomurabacteria bacterium]|jgi:adenylate kinase family enzyme|nr:nucleoside monophosphate kinase [Candidatus Nomurabacteria bacterium]
MKTIGLFGPAGSGKSSQGQRLASFDGWVWISTGELLRKDGNEEILRQLATSKLIDDEYVTGLLVAELEKARAEHVQVAVIDGYPRTARQVGLMVEHDLKMDVALLIELTFEEAWERIQLRGRETDNEAVARERFEVYEQNMYSIRTLLEEQGTRFVDIDGAGSVETVAERIEQILTESGLR